ncbi:RES family NAD+ phosphorylase [Ectothiorhodospira marina]|uniref:RES domain-containing protein n=1 Tax=Ectothiorhodospira marina TaxID=1396821 RepID=A0A1H7FRS4_9GAMM|nr:RES family NAD+ phosphorylase [Ectothiorhodospira marina]SEK28793.1 RES domain-containing protein [Ectothiorhodospira marina]
MNLWEVCEGSRQVGPIRGTLYRLVESQEQVATLGYVDTLEEQALLESMLEAAKPPGLDHAQAYHYLLRPPFRYPPLPWGSRFGRVHERGIFYGGSGPSVTLAEAAYYRLIFWHSMEGAPVKERICTEHTLFSVGYRTRQGIRLQAPPFDDHLDTLTHPHDYSHTQPLGTAMRDAGVEAFEYRSARDPDQDTCIGLFTPWAFARKQPDAMTPWLCELTAHEVLFKSLGEGPVTRFGIDTFTADGQLPMPAP